MLQQEDPRWAAHVEAHLSSKTANFAGYSCCLSAARCGLASCTDGNGCFWTLVRCCCCCFVRSRRGSAALGRLSGTLLSISRVGLLAACSDTLLAYESPASYGSCTACGSDPCHSAFSSCGSSLSVGTSDVPSNLLFEPPLQQSNRPETAIVYLDMDALGWTHHCE